MDLYEFQKLALRTEGLIDNVTVNKNELLNITKAYALLGDLLDAYKKKIFYKKAKKYDETFRYVLHEAIELLNETAENHELGLENEEILDVDTRVFHGMFGILTESGELAEIAHKYVDTGVLDTVHLFEELADGAGGTNSWYSAILCDALNVDPYLPMEKVIAKLRARYPEKYDDELADNRDLVAERKALEHE